MSEALLYILKKILTQKDLKSYFLMGLRSIYIIRFIMRKALPKPSILTVTEPQKLFLQM